MKTLIKISMVVLLAALTTSCTVKVSYRFLDNMIGWQLKQYVDLKGQQKKDADAAIDDFHAWHRQTQLTFYADYLENLKSGMLDGTISPEYLHQESNKLQDLLDISMAQLLPSVAEIAATLNESQISQVTEKLEKNRREYRRDYIEAKDKDIQKRRIRDITRYIGGFFGRFTAEQKQRLKTWEEALAPHEELMIHQQLTWEADFIEAMNYQNNPVELQNRLRNLMLYRTDNWDPELQRRLNINQDLTFEMLADLFNSQTEKQRNKMKRKFDHYIKDLRELSQAD